MVFLWTDVLMHLLFLSVVLSVLYIRKKEHLRRPWQKVVQSKVGVVSMFVLSTFLVLGLLDSIHYQSAKEQRVLSVLDVGLTPLRLHSEKTYSAPFASVAYAKEMQQQANGEILWHYPKLVYGGAHLAPSDDRVEDVLAKAGWGALKGFSIWLILGLSLFALKNFQWASLTILFKYSLASLLVVLISTFTIAELSSFYHVLGTDKVGEDVLYQALKSIRTGLVIGSLTTLVMLPIAVTLGLLSGFFRGWVDDVIQYIYTTLSSIPGVLLIAAAILMAQVYMANHPDLFAGVERRADMRLLFLCLILGITSWTGLCRLLRAETLKIREMDYVMAAKALGVGNFTLLKRHILPNIFHLVMISVVLDFSGLVLAEAVLSYVNIGVDPATYSWGNMINSARLEMAREPIVWWSLTAAFIFMLGLVLAANLFADTVRDAFDPRSFN